MAEDELTAAANAPREVVLLGIQPGSTDWGLQLSTEVTAALPLLMLAAEKQILFWIEPSAA